MDWEFLGSRLLVLMAAVTASGGELVENSHYWELLDVSGCITRVDTGALCDLATFPSSPPTIQDVNYCCSNPLSFQEFGFCDEGNHFNVPVCHSYSSVLKGEFETLDSNIGNTSLIKPRQPYSQQPFDLPEQVFILFT